MTLVTARNRHWAALFVLVVATVLYLGTNHVHFTAPRLLPLTWVDMHVPFLPHSVWIYNTDYFFFLLVYALVCTDLDALNKYTLSFLALIVASGLIFMVWPTVYPRDLFPLPANLDAATAGAFQGLRWIDSPANCCPSLHVSGVTLSWLALKGSRRSAALTAFFFVWGSLIVVSTLTTKQHYFIDVVSGAVLAAVFYRLFHPAAVRATLAAAAEV